MEDGLHEGASLRVVVQRIRRARLMLSVAPPLNLVFSYYFYLFTYLLIYLFII
jgi:hypothetical protein